MRLRCVKTHAVPARRVSDKLSFRDFSVGLGLAKLAGNKPGGI